MFRHIITISLAFTLLFSASMFGFTTQVSAQATPTINYQGKLTNASGLAVPDDAYNMRFYLYNTTGGATTTNIWEEVLTTTNKVQVTNGLFSVMLGSTTALTSVDFNQALYLGMEVGGTSTITWDGEMSPRKPLGTVPAAFEAFQLGGVASSSFLRSDAADILSANTAGNLLTIQQLGSGNLLSLLDSSANDLFTVTQNGEVGIGTTTMNQMLNVASTSGAGVRFTDTTNSVTLEATTNDTLATLGTVSNHALQFTTNNTARLTVTSGGGIGIGTTTPNYDLVVDGDFQITGSLIDNSYSAGTNGQILQTTGSGIQWVATSSLGFGASFTDSEELAALLSDETGSVGGGNAVFSNNPLLTGFFSNASSTIGDGTATGGLTISGNSTTTGNAIFNSYVGIGTNNPLANLSIQGGVGQSNNLFSFASSTINATGTAQGLYAQMDAGGKTTFTGRVLNPVLVGQLDDGGEARHITIFGNYAYVADGGDGLEIIDISDPTNPIEVGQWDDGGEARSVAISGNYAYVADSGDGLEIIDISNPTTPIEVGQFHDGNLAIDVVISGNYAYVADNSDGLEIIDISDPTNPIEVGQFDPSDFATSVTVSGNLAFITYDTEGVRIVDVSNVSNPIEVSQFNNGKTVYNLVLSGIYAYVAASSDGLEIIDISDPTAPVEVGVIKDGSTVYDVTVSGNYAYVADYSDGLEIIDISNPTTPIEVGRFKSGDVTEGVVISGNHAYVVDFDDGLQIVDIGALEAANLYAGNIRVDQLTVDQTAIFDAGINVRGSANIGSDTLIGGALAVTKFATTSLTGIAALTANLIDNNVASIADVLKLSHSASGTIANGIGAGILFATDDAGTGTSTSRIASILTDVSTTSPRSALTFSNKNTAGSLTEFMRLTADGYLGLGTTTPGAKLTIQGTAGDTANLLTLANADGDTVVSVSDRGAVRINQGQLSGVGSITDEVGGADELDGASSITIAGNYAYVASFADDGVQILDISDPTNPIGVGSITDETNGADELEAAFSITIAGNYAYVASRVDDGVQILDISDPTNPIGVGSITDDTNGADTLAGANSITIAGNYAYVAASSDDGVQILDISDPTNPIGVGSITDETNGADRLDGANSITIAGNYAYVATGFPDNGVQVLDISDPTNPIGVGSITDETNGADRLDGANSITIAGNYAYVASSFLDNGVQILDISDPTNPIGVGSITDGANGADRLSGATSITIAGNYAYVASFADDGVQILSLNNLTTPTAEIGTVLADRIDTTTLNTDNTNIRSSLNVGTNALIGGALTITGTASTTLLANNTNPALLINSGNVGIGTSSPTSKLSLQTNNFSGAGVIGIDQYLQTANTVESAVQFGNRLTLNASNTATTTIVGSIVRIEDNTEFGNTVRGLEVQSNRGVNTNGENTAISGFGRTFGIRGVTNGDAGSTFDPAGGFFENQNATQGNAIRGYSGNITTTSLLALFQDTSAFAGTGLEMNFGNTTGTFEDTDSKYLDFQNAGVSVFSVSAFGTTTIGDGTTNNLAGLQIGFGGICVDNDGTCTASTSGRITSVESQTGNSDLAEIYFSDVDLEPGEIVVLRNQLSVERATTDSTTPILGVVSTKPGLTLGFDDTSLTEGEKGFPIALKGRVPIKLSTENGPITRGDQLMLSSLPGIAMKATGTGATIGIALEDFDDTRMYSDTYINQFGDDMVDPVFTPVRTNADPRINDGCYFGGGSEAGEEPCVPLVSTSTTAQIAEVNDILETESIEEQLAELTTIRPDRKTLPNGERVQVGQIVMFVQNGHRWLDGQMGAALTALTQVDASELDEMLGAEQEVDGGVLGRVVAAVTAMWERMTTIESRVDMLEAQNNLLQERIDEIVGQSTNEVEYITTPESVDDDDEENNTDIEDDSSTEEDTDSNATSSESVIVPTATTTDISINIDDEGTQAGTSSSENVPVLPVAESAEVLESDESTEIDLNQEEELIDEVAGDTNPAEEEVQEVQEVQEVAEEEVIEESSPVEEGIATD